jgi:phage terminase large subunit-like protein
MCSNVVLKTDPAGNIKLDKANSTNKIDGMVALVMALGEYMAKVEPPPQVNIRLL